MEVENDKKQSETSTTTDYKLLSASHVIIANVGAFPLQRITNSTMILTFPYHLCIMYHEYTHTHQHAQKR